MASLCCACGVTWTGSHRCGETPDEAAFRRNRGADLRAAYERGVRDSAEEAGTFVRDVAVKPVLANACRLRILALLDKEGGRG